MEQPIAIATVVLGLRVAVKGMVIFAMVSIESDIASKDHITLEYFAVKV